MSSDENDSIDLGLDSDPPGSDIDEEDFEVIDGDADDGADEEEGESDDG